MQKLVTAEVRGIAAPQGSETPGLHWAESGSGEALLLLHGGHGGLVHWAANIDTLAHDWRVLAPDMAGFGGSYDPGRCLLPEEQAALLAAWLRQLGITRVRVAGFSFGTLVAAALALAEPQLVQALLFVNPPGVGPRSEDAMALPGRLSAVAKAHGHRAGIEATLHELMLSQHQRITPELVDRMTQAARATRHLTRDISRGSQLLPQMQQLAGTLPLRVLIGERDPFHRHDLPGRRAAIDAVLGEGATRFVPEAAHWLQYDQPETFAAELRHFFQEKPEETTP